MWKLSTSHSAAGVIAPSSRIAAAIVAVALEQDAPVVPHARREPAAGLAPGEDALAGEALRVLLEPLGAEQLGPDGVLGPRREWRRGCVDQDIAQ